MPSSLNAMWLPGSSTWAEVSGNFAVKRPAMERPECDCYDTTQVTRPWLEGMGVSAIRGRSSVLLRTSLGTQRKTPSPQARLFPSPACSSGSHLLTEQPPDDPNQTPQPCSFVSLPFSHPTQRSAPPSPASCAHHPVSAIQRRSLSGPTPAFLASSQHSHRISIGLRQLEWLA